jgi:hypothetical protein
MVDAAQPPNTADIEAQYDLHRAKREQQMEKLEVEVAEMRAEQALQAQLELEVLHFAFIKWTQAHDNEMTFTQRINFIASVF